MLRIVKSGGSGDAKVVAYALFWRHSECVMTIIVGGTETGSSPSTAVYLVGKLDRRIAKLR